MALETMKGVKEINGVKILQERIYFPQEEGKLAEINWHATDEARKECPVFVDHDVNMISFRIQNGPIKEVGKNGCQVTTLIEVAKHMVAVLNEKFPCAENEMTIHYLSRALEAQAERTLNRERRGVEGRSES